MKGQSEEIKSAWLCGETNLLRILLSESNVVEHEYLLDMDGHSVGWLFSAGTNMWGVFLDVCIEQKIESLQLERIAIITEHFGEYTGFAGQGLRVRASAVAKRANLQQKSNRETCRATVISLLGCCGKQRKAAGGTMRDVSQTIARMMWTTRRRDLWK
jgi:hypothetical protein